MAQEKSAAGWLIADIAALCAAIDAGDDEALHILADAMEEDGECTMYLRMVAFGANSKFRAIRPRPVDGQWAWAHPTRAETPSGVSYDPSVIIESIFDRLLGGVLASPSSDNDSGLAVYPTRSAAYIALAEALAHE